MAKAQITIGDSTTLDNGTWRLMHGQTTDADSNGVRVVTQPFTITGSTPQECQERYNATRDDFIIRNARIRVTMDGDAASPGEYLIDESPGSNKIGQTNCTVALANEFTNTTTTLNCLLIWTGNYYQTTSIGGAGSTGDESAVVDGLAQTPQIVTSYNAGRVERRSVYLVFVSDEGNSGKVNYEAQRSAILTDVLGTAEDGARDDTTGLALVAENIEQDGTASATYEVRLDSEYVEEDIANGLRKLELSISVEDAKAWSAAEGAGVAPTFITVAGAASWDQTADVADSVLWAAIKAKVDERVQQYIGLANGEQDGGGGGSALVIEGPSVQRIRKTGELRFQLRYQASNLEVIAFSLHYSYTTQTSYVRTVTGDGFHRVQLSPGPDERSCTVTLVRIGRGLGLLDPELYKPDDEAGFVWWYDGDQYGRTAPQLRREYGDDVYEINASWKYSRLRFANTTAAQTVPDPPPPEGGA